MKPAFKFKPLAMVATIIGVAYPFVVYFGLQVVTPLVIVFCLLGFLSFRILLKWREKSQMIELVPLSLTLSCVVVLLFFDELLAVKVYPVALSLSLAIAFGYSLLNPPSIIERFARITEPYLNEAGVRYTRNVTIMWVMFFVLNATVSLWTSFRADLKVWTFYNGFLSYMLLAALIGIEFIIRQFVKKKHKGVRA